MLYIVLVLAVVVVVESVLIACLVAPFTEGELEEQRHNIRRAQP